jgi:hypothetical protein
VEGRPETLTRLRIAIEVRCVPPKALITTEAFWRRNLLLLAAFGSRGVSRRPLRCKPTAQREAS